MTLVNLNQQIAANDVGDDERSRDQAPGAARHHDLATPWAELACDDKIVVGLSLDEHSNDEIPTLYKYHVRPTAARAKDLYTI